MSDAKNVYRQGTGKANVFSVHAMKVYAGNIVIAPLVLALHGSEWLTSHPDRLTAPK